MSSSSDLALPQPDLRREGALFFVSGVTLEGLLPSFEVRECPSSVGIESIVVLCAPGNEFIGARMHFDEGTAGYDGAVVNIRRALLPSGEGVRHDFGIFEDGEKFSVLLGTTEPQHAGWFNSSIFHLSLLVAALRKNFAAYQRCSVFSSYAHSNTAPSGLSILLLRPG